MQSLDNIKENVRRILTEYPETRGNDNKLILRYWARFDNSTFEQILYLLSDDQLSKITSAESIRRVRQKLQNEEGAFLPGEEVVTARRAREADMRRWANSE